MKTVLVRAEATSVFARGTVQGKGDATVKHHVELVSRMVCNPATSLERGRLLGCSRKVGRDPGLAIIAIRVENLEGIERPSRDRKLGGEDIWYPGKGWVHRGRVANTVKRALVHHVLQEGNKGILMHPFAVLTKKYSILYPVNPLLAFRFIDRGASTWHSGQSVRL